MITASDLRKGSKFIYKGEPHMCLDYQHVKPGKGGAFVKTKMKNMISGAIYGETFRTEEKFHRPDLQYHNVQFLYSDPEGYHLMDQESYEQLSLTAAQLESETIPGVRGDTAQGRATKPATLETGFVLQVPLFVNQGDKVKIDTRDSKYIERVKK